jgi:hypothetical protein
LADITTSFVDNTFEIKDNVDATKKLVFQLSSQLTGVTNTITIPSGTGGTLPLTYPNAPSTVVASGNTNLNGKNFTFTGSKLQGDASVVTGTLYYNDTSGTTSATTITLTTIINSGYRPNSAGGVSRPFFGTATLAGTGLQMVAAVVATTGTVTLYKVVTNGLAAFTSGASFNDLIIPLAWEI